MRNLIQLLEGGNIFKDETGKPITRRINQDEIPATVAWLEKITGLSLPRNDDDHEKNTWLGSTGKKADSGDLDLRVNQNLVSKDHLEQALQRWAIANKQDPKKFIKKAGISVHFLTPVEGNPSNGWVQSDFMFTMNPRWTSWIMSSDPSSAYKGASRNVLMNSLGKALGYKINQNAGLFDRATNTLITDDPNQVAKMLLNPDATAIHLRSVESILQALQNDPKKEAKLADFKEYMAREGTPLPDTMAESEGDDVNFLARLRDRIVNQGHVALVEAEEPGVGGRAKGIEHLEDYVFRHGLAGVKMALDIVKHAAESPTKTTTVKWDGKPALVFGRKPSTGEFVLTDGSGFEAKGYDGLATSPQMMAQIQSQRSGNRTELIQLYATLFPILEAAVPQNFRGYVKGDLLYMDTPPLEAGNYVFKPNTVQYRIPAKTSLGQRIGNSTIGVAMHSMYGDVGEPRQPLERVKFNNVPGLLLIEPISGKEIVPNAAIIKQIKQTANSADGRAISTLFNPAELRAQQITDLAKLCVDYINYRIPSGHFDNLLPEFGIWLQGKVSPRKFKNIVEYLQSPSSNQGALAAAFTLFIMLHELKLDILKQLDLKDPGHEGWVMATPAGYAKAVNRFDFTARNRAQNNPQQG